MTTIEKPVETNNASVTIRLIMQGKVNITVIPYVPKILAHVNAAPALARTLTYLRAFSRT